MGREACNCSVPLRRYGSRLMPIERMLRIIWFGDSSNAKYKQRSPRLQVASAKCAAMLVLPVPAVPLTRIEEPR